MSDEQTAARGSAAQRELDMTEEAFATLREAILNELAETSPIHSDKILKLHLSVQNLSAVRKALLMVVQSGQIAKFAMSEAGLTSL